MSSPCLISDFDPDDLSLPEVDAILCQPEEYSGINEDGGPHVPFATAHLPSFDIPTDLDSR